MNTEFITLIVTMIIGGLTFSFGAFIYMHQTFPSKEVFKMVIKQLERIEEKLDHMKTEP